MAPGYSQALDLLAPAFARPGDAFIFYYRILPDKSVERSSMIRGELYDLARKAAAAIIEKGLSRGDHFANCFGMNHPHDLAFRLAATMTGTVPVTVNWQADTLERLRYKIDMTGCKLILFDPYFKPEMRDSLLTGYPDIETLDVFEIDTLTPLPESDFCREVPQSFTRNVIFTSGTTGEPKGVRLTYQNYETNRLTFDHWLELGPEKKIGLISVNPLHHGNATSITDWALRRPGAELHLLDRYSTRYWAILAEAAERGYDFFGAPLVARHFDFLESLIQEERLPLDFERLKAAMKKTDFLLGSAPVGPTTIRRLLGYTGRLPHVRLGATENTLEALGTPISLTPEQKLSVFERGWSHTYNGEPTPGYWIGRPHPPLTDARAVKSVSRDDPGFMIDSPHGEPGFLVTRGDNHMAGYVQGPEATAAVFEGDWYIGIGDVCFTLQNEFDKGTDFYWMSRVSHLLIRGGANYACDQINSELRRFVISRYGLAREDFDLAVAGLLVDSEHDDSCCVTIELLSGRARSLEAELRSSFIADAKAVVTKGAAPDYLRIAPVPRNFKGAILVPELKDSFRRSLASGECEGKEERK